MPQLLHQRRLWIRLNRRCSRLESPLSGVRRARQRMSAQWSGSLVVSQQPRPRGVSYKRREMNKQIVKQTMLSLEARDLKSAREKYLEYVGSARLDRSEPIEDDEQAQAELASDLSEAFDDTVHSHSDKIERLSAMDFGPKSKVEEGAVVKLGGRFFVIAVSTGRFVCDGKEIMASPPRHRSMLS
jgi:hypothetical protein